MIGHRIDRRFVEVGAPHAFRGDWFVNRHGGDGIFRGSSPSMQFLMARERVLPTERSLAFSAYERFGSSVFRTSHLASESFVFPIVHLRLRSCR